MTDDTDWPKVNGQVVCKELGLGECKGHPTKQVEDFASADNWIMSEEMISCKGNESSIKDCKTTPWKEVPRDPRTTYYSIYVVCTGESLCTSVIGYVRIYQAVRHTTMNTLNSPQVLK